MRLLRCTSPPVLEEFSEEQVPLYAILSHTWSEGEVSFQDFQAGYAHWKPGYQKLLRCCEEASKDGFNYTCVDTCCIDKTSSSELFEAINFMYRWYQQAGVCYVYLKDVLNVSEIREDLQQVEIALSGCSWFTRGWTLQQLIAPSSVIFFNSSWEEVGTKSSLQPMISRITGIQVEVLLGAHVENFSVAQRMSWAAKRKTTRLEDLAYCLMGLFGVNMPMLYGEGDRAFIRLQEEIMKVCDDDSIFAWRSSKWGDGGLLARSPAAFAESGHVVRSTRGSGKTFTLTNKGIKLQVLSRSWGDTKIRLACLDCESPRENSQIGIILKRTSSIEQQFVGDQSDVWVMVGRNESYSFDSTDVYVRAERREKTASTYSRCHVSTARLGEYGFSLEDTYHKEMFRQGSEEENIANSWPLTNLPDEMVAVLKIGDTHGVPFFVLLKTKAGQLLVNVEQWDGSESLKEIFWSFDIESPTSPRKRTWSDEPNRVFWKQPN